MPDDTERPRLLKFLLDGLRMALREPDQVREVQPDGSVAEPGERMAQLPPDSVGFDAGVRASKVLHETACPSGEPNPLGPFVLPPDQQDPEDRRFYYPFQAYWRRLFRRASEQEVETLQDFMSWMTPARLEAEKLRIAGAEERAALGRFWRRIRYGAVSIALTAFGVAAWGIEKIPVIREGYHAYRDFVAWWHGG